MTRIRASATAVLALLLVVSAWVAPAEAQTKTVKVGFINHLTGDAAV